MESKSTTKIAIVGAGPAGLCLGNILQKNNIPFTIFEGDKSPHERSQGGTLDLDPQFGQLALKEAGLWDEYVKYARPEADVMKIVKANGEVLWDGNGANKLEVPEEKKFDHKPEIDREKLKDVLFAHLNLDNVKFGKHIQEVVPNNDRYDIHFKDGSIEPGFDMVVGADGAWSKVRPLLTDIKPYYSGISFVELWLNDADNANPWVSQYVGAGSCFCFNEGRAILAQRLGDGSIRTYAGLQKPESFLKDCGLDFINNPDEAREQYVERYWSDYSDDLKRLLLESNSKVVTRVLYMLPVGIRWQPRKGLALLGDAAHLMTPFAGVGVNAALADARELAKAIVEAHQSSRPLTDAITEYEPEMFVRGERFAQRTYNNLKGRHFTANGPENYAKLFHDHVAQMKLEAKEGL